jgi:UDP-glucose:(heptosyl)LPS alpha-1,3-glucosyltransferase
LATAVEAFRAASGPLDRLLVAGADRHADRWLRWAASRLGEKLVWLGPTRSPARWYAACDLLLSPSWYDAGSNVLLEALASGLPVLSSLRDGSSELSPWPALDPEDQASWAQALQRRLDEPGDRDQARASVEPLTLERMTQGWLSLLEELDAR